MSLKEMSVTWLVVDAIIVICLIVELAILFNVLAAFLGFALFMIGSGATATLHVYWNSSHD